MKNTYEKIKDGLLVENDQSKIEFRLNDWGQVKVYVDTYDDEGAKFVFGIEEFKKIIDLLFGVNKEITEDQLQQLLRSCREKFEIYDANHIFIKFRDSDIFIMCAKEGKEIKVSQEIPFEKVYTVLSLQEEKEYAEYLRLKEKYENTNY